MIIEGLFRLRVFLEIFLFADYRIFIIRDSEFLERHPFRSNILKTTKETLLKKFQLLRNANRGFLSIFILLLLNIHVFFFYLSFALLIIRITSIRSKCKIAKN